MNSIMGMGDRGVGYLLGCKIMGVLPSTRPWWMLTERVIQGLWGILCVGVECRCLPSTCGGYGADLMILVEGTVSADILFVW